jgi:hypothetical protein
MAGTDINALTPILNGMPKEDRAELRLFIQLAEHEQGLKDTAIAQLRAANREALAIAKYKKEGDDRQVKRRTDILQYYIDTLMDRGGGKAAVRTAQGRIDRRTEKLHNLYKGEGGDRASKIASLSQQLNSSDQNTVRAAVEGIMGIDDLAADSPSVAGSARDSRFLAAPLLKRAGIDIKRIIDPDGTLYGRLVNLSPRARDAEIKKVRDEVVARVNNEHMGQIESTYGGGGVDADVIVNEWLPGAINDQIRADVEIATLESANKAEQKVIDSDGEFQDVALAREHAYLLMADDEARLGIETDQRTTDFAAAMGNPVTGGNPLLAASTMTNNPTAMEQFLSAYAQKSGDKMTGNLIIDKVRVMNKARQRLAGDQVFATWAHQNGYDLGGAPPTPRMVNRFMRDGRRISRRGPKGTGKFAQVTAYDDDYAYTGADGSGVLYFQNDKGEHVKPSEVAAKADAALADANVVEFDLADEKVRVQIGKLLEANPETSGAILTALREMDKKGVNPSGRTRLMVDKTSNKMVLLNDEVVAAAVGLKEGQAVVLDALSQNPDYADVVGDAGKMRRGESDNKLDSLDGAVEAERFEGATAYMPAGYSTTDTPASQTFVVEIADVAAGTQKDTLVGLDPLTGETRRWHKADLLAAEHATPEDAWAYIQERTAPEDAQRKYRQTARRAKWSTKQGEMPWDQVEPVADVPLDYGATAPDTDAYTDPLAATAGPAAADAELVDLGAPDPTGDLVDASQGVLADVYADPLAATGDLPPEPLVTGLLPEDELALQQKQAREGFGAPPVVAPPSARAAALTPWPTGGTPGSQGALAEEYLRQPTTPLPPAIMERDMAEYIKRREAAVRLHGEEEAERRWPAAGTPGPLKTMGDIETDAQERLKAEERRKRAALEAPAVADAAPTATAAALQ